jgi:tetratricopeptide (TPR) repeat protein
VHRFRFLTISVLIFAALGVALVHGEIPLRTRAELGDPFVPRPEVAKLSSVGFHTVMADYYWLQAVQVVGTSMRPEDEGTLLGRYIDVVTTVDPWVGHPYRFAAVWLTGSEEDVRQANRILERSFDYHPDEWRNRFYLGFNYFFYLEESEPAAHWLEEAAKIEGSPRYLAGLAARLRAGNAGLEVAASMIRRFLADTDDPYARAEYEKMLDEIETERRARFLDGAREAYRKGHGEDIEKVEDLLAGPYPVLQKLPPEPHDWEWILDEESGDIVSSYYERRYRPHFSGEDQAEIRGWRVKGVSREPSTGKSEGPS